LVGFQFTILYDVCMSQIGKGRILVLVGPSGVGKDTILRHLLQIRPGLLYSVSYTTRQPREGEVEGRDYRFVDKETFFQLIEAGEFLEFKDVHGFFYGTPKGPLEQAVRNGKEIALILDIKGAFHLHEMGLDPILVFLAPPSISEWERRIEARGLISREEAETRLRNGREELKAVENFPHVIVADGVDKPGAALVALLDGQPEIGHPERSDQPEQSL
jgi:guanylate kinase